jgi:hypothetical protein
MMSAPWSHPSWLRWIADTKNYTAVVVTISLCVELVAVTCLLILFGS